MPDQKITDLVDGTPLQPTDEFVVARAGDNFKIDGADVVAAVTKHDVTLSGNTAGALALVSSGTMTLAGGNNITLSQAGNAITISGANVGGAQTGISGLANSQTTYTSGTVSLSELGALTIRSSTGQIFQIEAPATSSLEATGAVSISINGSTISIGAPVQSTQIETQTFIGGISASDTLYTSGTVRLTGVGGGVTVSSNTGQRVDISVAAPVAQSVQTQNMIAATLSGNTDGALALVSSGTLTLAGGNNITLSQAGNAVTISGPNVGGAQTGISGIVGSDATYTSGTVTFSGVGGGVTINSNTGQRIDISVAAQSVQPETQTFIAGISASDTLYTSGNVRISGSQAVTVRSGTGQLVIVDAPAQTNQAGNVYASSNTFGTSSGTYDARSISIAGRGEISVAASNSGWIISAPVQSVQPETQTFIAGVSASDTLYTSGNVRITGVGGGVTVSSNTGQRIDISVAAPVAATNLSVGVSTGGNTLGDTGVATGSRFVIVGSNGITASQGTAAGATTVTLSGITQTVQTQGGFVSLGVSTGGNTAGNTQVSTGSRFVLVGLGEVSLSQATAAGASTVSISAPAQTVQTQGVLSVGVSTGGNTSGNTTVNTGSRFVIVGSNGITASQGTAAGATTVTLSGVTQSVQTQGILNVALSNVGNTAGDTGINSGTRLVLSGGANITLSQVTAANATTLGIVGGAGGAGGSFSGGVSTGGNTAGATGITGTQNVFVGVTPISLSQTTGANGGTISINAPATSSLSATGGVEISTNGSTISIGAPVLKTLGDFQNFPLNMAALITHAASISKTPFYFPMEIPGKITNNSFVIRLSAVTTATLQSFTIHGGFYTMVNSTSMALLGSWSETYVQSTASSVSWSGVRNYVMTAQGTHTALSVLTGGDYAVGLMFSAGAAGSMAQSIMGAGSVNPTLGRIVPGVNAQSTGTSQGAIPLMGRGSTTVNVLPANVVASELVNQGAGASAQLHPWIYIRS